MASIRARSLGSPRSCKSFLCRSTAKFDASRNGKANHVRIQCAPPAWRREALELVFSQLPLDDRHVQIRQVLRASEANPSVLSGLLCAQGEQVGVAGAVFAQLQAGGTAAVWLPRLAPGVPPATADALMAAVCAWLDCQKVHLAQVLLPTVSEADCRVLECARFNQLAELLYLAAASPDFPEQEPAETLQFVPVTAQEHAQLADVVAATYEATRDCAGLNEVRPMSDVMAGYAAAGETGADNWFLVHNSGRVVGCLLLADHRRQDNVELVYMGVLPAWRGRGWGVEITRWAQWRTRLLQRARLVLAVDAENAPALDAYAASGFRAWDRWIVYIRIFGRGDGREIRRR